MSVAVLDRDAACLELLPLVERLARGLARLYRFAEYPDVYQDGCVGMVRAISTYDASHGTKLQTYARPLILGAILNGIRERDPVSEHARALLRQAERTREARIRERREVPTMRELADQISGLGAAVLIAHRAQVRSLDDALADHDAFAADWDADPQRIVVERERAQRVRSAIGELSERERAVVHLRYYQQRSIAAIGEELALSIGRVAQLRKRAIVHMRRTLSEA